MGITYNGTKIKKAVFNGAPLKQIMLNGVKLLSSEPFNEALALVGYGEFDTLESVLSDTNACNALAYDDTAVEIMRSNYSDDIVNAVDTKWSDGLNLLSYKCGLKCFIYRNGNECTNITGGWARNNCHNADGYLQFIRGVNGFACTNSKVGANHTVIKANVTKNGCNFAKLGYHNDLTMDETFVARIEFTNTTGLKECNKPIGTGYYIKMSGISYYQDNKPMYVDYIILS